MKYFKPLPKEKIIKVESIGNSYKFYYFNGDPNGTYRHLSNLTEAEKRAINEIEIKIEPEIYTCSKCLAITQEIRNGYYCPNCDEERFYLR